MNGNLGVFGWDLLFSKMIPSRQAALGIGKSIWVKGIRAKDMEFQGVFFLPHRHRDAHALFFSSFTLGFF